jgi:hypothetical protein
MTREERKRRNAQERSEFQKSALDWRIRCAKRALNLAPLAEYHNAIAALENYRDGFGTRGDLKRVYREIHKGYNNKTLFYGYTAVGEIYLGLLSVLYSTLHPRGIVSSCDCQRFCEARYCAGWHAGDSGFGQKAMLAEMDWQAKEFDEVMNAHNVKWNRKVA